MPIMVNKIEISDDEVHAEMQYHPAGDLDGARQKAAQALVIRQLLIQEALGQKILSGSDVENQEMVEEAMDKLLQQEVTVPMADDEICERYYEQNKERFKDQKSGELLPLEMVMDHITDYLHARSLKTGISQYIKVLAGRSRIAGFEFDGAESPLVQ